MEIAIVNRQGPRPTPIAFAPARALRRRAGTIAMELLLNLPIWMIALLGIVEVGEMLTSAQHVSLCSRVGAEDASRTDCLPSSGEVPDGVVDAVTRQLASAGMSPVKIILEHNAGGARTVLISGSGPGNPPKTPLPARGTYVRVTVCARMNRFVAKLLCSLGLDFSSQRLRDSVTFRYAGHPAENE
jgi:hypothetical protein